MPHNKDYLEEVIKNPKTIGEKVQAERLKKFSQDPNDIIRVRDKLNKLKEELEPQKSKDDIILPKGGYDKKGDSGVKKFILVEPPSFLEQFFLFGAAKEEFKKKYGVKNRKIIPSFVNLLFRKAAFYLGEEVLDFLEDRVIPVLYDLRQPFSVFYDSGWLDAKGRVVLSPEEFNLIVKAKDVIDNEDLSFFKKFHKKPYEALKELKLFLRDFFTMVWDKSYVSKLLDSVYKSIDRIIDDEFVKEKRKDIIANLEFLFGGDFEREFVIPLFEAVWLRAFSSEDIRKFIFVEPISKDEYQGDPKLVASMEAKRKRYKKELKERIDKIEEELDFIESLKESLSYKISLPFEEKAKILDGIILIMLEGDRRNMMKLERNLSRLLSALIEAFNIIYSFILEGTVKVKTSGDIKDISIFTEDVFSKELSNIRRYQKDLSIYNRFGFEKDILKKEKLSKEERSFIDLLNHLNDNFYFVGEKIYRAISGHIEHIKDSKNKNIIPEPVSSKSLGKAIIPYYDHQIVLLSTGQMTIKYSVGNRKISEVLKEIKAFAFNFSYEFEYAYRDFSKSVRLESIRDKLSKEPKLEEELDRLRREYEEG